MVGVSTGLFFIRYNKPRLFGYLFLDTMSSWKKENAASAVKDFGVRKLPARKHAPMNYKLRLFPPRFVPSQTVERNSDQKVLELSTALPAMR